MRPRDLGLGMESIREDRQINGLEEKWAEPGATSLVPSAWMCVLSVCLPLVYQLEGGSLPSLFSGSCAMVTSGCHMKQHGDTWLPHPISLLSVHKNHDSLSGRLCCLLGTAWWSRPCDSPVSPTSLINTLCRAWHSDYPQLYWTIRLSLSEPEGT